MIGHAMELLQFMDISQGTLSSSNLFKDLALVNDTQHSI